MTDPPRFQFSLRTLLMVVTLYAVALGAAKAIGLGLALEFSGLAWSFIFVLLLALSIVPFDRTISRLEGWRLFAVTAILFCCLNSAFFLFDAVVNQPHYVVVFGYEQGIEWLTRAVAGSAVTTALTAIFLLLPVGFIFALPKLRPKGHAYYPQLANVWCGLGLPHVRLILMIGGLLVVLYYAVTIIQVSWPQQGGYVRSLPPRVWISCHLLWALLWLVDCTLRPNRGMLIVAIGYLCVAILILLLCGFRSIEA